MLNIVLVDRIGLNWEQLAVTVVVFQESGSGSLPGPSVEGEQTARSLCGRGEHQNHSAVFTERPRRYEGNHHEGNDKCFAKLCLRFSSSPTTELSVAVSDR